MRMIWCNGLLSTITGHLHGHEFIYQRETALLVSSGSTFINKPVGPWCCRLGWLWTSRELELQPKVSLIINQRVQEMTGSGSWQPWWHCTGHQKVEIEMQMLLSRLQILASGWMVIFITCEVELLSSMYIWLLECPTRILLRWVTDE